MACVWVEAWAGARRMGEEAAILALQPPVDHRLKDSSAWLRTAREKAAAAVGAAVSR
jgi:hypothetical protein